MLGNEDKDGYELLKRAQAMMASGVPTNRGNVVNQFGGYTPTADLKTQRIPVSLPVEQSTAGKPWNYPFDEEGLKYQTGENPVKDKGADINKAYDSVYSEQAKRNYVEESAKPKTAEPVNYTEQTFGLGGSLNFKDQGAKREVLRFIGAKQNAQNVNYQVNREATQKAREAGDSNAIIYDFNVEDSDGNEYEINGVSANSLSELFARLRKPEASKEAVLSDSPRRVRRKGEDWRLDINAPIEDGLVSIEKTTDFDRDLGEFGSRMLSGISGTAANLVVGAGQGLVRAASYLSPPNQKYGLQVIADSEFFSDPKTRANNLVQNYGPENQYVGAAASGIGSVATIAPLGYAGLAGAAASSFEDGVQYSRELSDRNGEERSDFRDVAMGLGYGAAEFLAERIGLQSIKRAINPTAARKIGERMINEAMTSSPNILPRLFQAAKGTGTAAAVNYAEEFATNLGQEGINDLFYEVDRDLWKTVQDANLAGIGGAFGGGVTTVAGQAAQSIAGSADRGLRGNLIQSEGQDATALSDQENYAITRLQRLGFTEQDALEEVIANRTGQKANTESRKQILEEFPESRATVEGLLSKAKKVYGDSAAKVRNLFGGARAEMDASVDEQIAAAESILTPEPVVAPEAPIAPEEALVQEQPITEAPIQEETPITDEEPIIEEPSQAPEDVDFTDEELASFLEEQGVTPEDIDATIAQEEQVVQEEGPVEEPVNTEQTPPVQEKKKRTRGRKKEAAAPVEEKDEGYERRKEILEQARKSLDELREIGERMRNTELLPTTDFSSFVSSKKARPDKKMANAEEVEYEEVSTDNIAQKQIPESLTIESQNAPKIEAIKSLRRSKATFKNRVRSFSEQVFNEPERTKESFFVNHVSAKTGIPKESLSVSENGVFVNKNGDNIQVASITGDAVSFKESDVNNILSAYNLSNTEAPNSTEGSTPGKRKTRAQRAKDVVNKAGEKLTDAIDKEIADRKGAALDITGIFTSPLLKVIRQAGITMQTTAVKALDVYIDLEAQAVEQGRTTLEQAIDNIRNYIQTNFAQGKVFYADKEIADIVNSTVADIPKRAEREAKKAAGRAKYEENMSKAEKNKAAKEVKNKAKTVIQGIVQKANKGLIDKHDEITILPSLLKLAERLEVNEAFIRQEYNEAVAALRIPNTTLNAGRASLSDARTYVTKYAQTLLNSRKNDLIKNKLVSSVLGRIDKLKSYAGILEQLEYIKKIMDDSNFANRLSETKKAIANAIIARRSTPGANELIKRLKVILALSDFQDLELLERITKVSNELVKSSVVPESLLKEVNDIAIALKLPVAKEAKEEKEGKEKAETSEKDVKEMATRARKALESALGLIKDISLDSSKILANLLGVDLSLGTNSTIEALSDYSKKNNNIDDVKKLATFLENAVGIYNSMIAGTGVSFETFIQEQFSTQTGSDIPDVILRIRAEKGAKDLKAENVDKVIETVAGVFKKANKNLAFKLLVGQWLGNNKRRNLEQTIERMVNYSSNASNAIGKVIREPLMKAFSRSETEVTELLHTIQKELDNAKLEKSSNIHIQAFGMLLDYLSGNSINHNYALFTENARDIQDRIKNGALDGNKKNSVKDSKAALEWFDKSVGKYNESTKEFDGPMAKAIKALDGVAVNPRADILVVARKVFGSSYLSPLTTMYNNIRDAGAMVRNNSLVYKEQQIDNRPFYWPRKAIGKVDRKVQVASNEYFDSSQFTSNEIKTLITDESRRGGQSFGQISTKTNPHSLARAQSDDVVYSLNAYDVMATYLTNSFNDAYVTPELIRINKILKTHGDEIFTRDGKNVLTNSIILLSKSAYNVGYKKFTNEFLRAVDPIITESSRIMLGSYFQIAKQSIPAIVSYVTFAEGNALARAAAIRRVMGNKENMSILIDIMALRTEQAKNKTRLRFKQAADESSFDFGISRSNAVIDSFRELSAQQGNSTYVDKIYEILDKTWLTKKYAGFVRDTSAALPVTDSYTRLIIYAAEIERRSGMSFADFMSRDNRSKENQRIISESDKAVSRIMGSSFSKDRSANLTMTADSDIQNLWKKMNFFMGNALAQNSTTFKDSLSAAMLDPENRGAHLKRAAMVTANAVAFMGVSSAIAFGLDKLISGLGYLAFGEAEEEDEEEDSLARKGLSGFANIFVQLFYGNTGNGMSWLVTQAINQADSQIRQSQEISNEEAQKIAMQIASAYQAKRLSQEEVIEEFKKLGRARKTSNRKLLYDGSKPYGPLAQVRPVLGLTGPYKGIGLTSVDIYELLDKVKNSEDGPKDTEYLKAITNVSKILPLMQPDLIRVANLTAKEFNKERKQDGEKRNSR